MQDNILMRMVVTSLFLSVWGFPVWGGAGDNERLIQTLEKMGGSIERVTEESGQTGLSICLGNCLDPDAGLRQVRALANVRAVDL
ncbi:MAG: hypothetical protein ACK4RK_05515 [Gemmataceae bacterium]